MKKLSERWLYRQWRRSEKVWFWVSVSIVLLSVVMSVVAVFIGSFTWLFTGAIWAFVAYLKAGNARDRARIG